MKLLNINALILSIAILSLSFTAFQAKIIEKNETAREAGFEMLKTLNHLQYLVDKEYYIKRDNESFLEGWSYVTLVQDLAIFSTDNVNKSVDELVFLWKNNFKKLHEKEINTELSNSIKNTRKNLKTALEEL